MIYKTITITDTEKNLFPSTLPLISLQFLLSPISLLLHCPRAIADIIFSNLISSIVLECIIVYNIYFTLVYFTNKENLWIWACFTKYTLIGCNEWCFLNEHINQNLFDN
jgi:hypothetical protein